MIDMKSRDVEILIELVLRNLRLTGPGRGGRANLWCCECRKGYELNGEQWRGIISFPGGTKQWELQAMWNIPHEKECQMVEGITILMQMKSDLR